MKHTSFITSHFSISIALLLAACSGVSVPESYTQADQLPAIYPDYADVTIPVNIAPLSFQLEQTDADDAEVRYSTGETEILCGGFKGCPLRRRGCGENPCGLSPGGRLSPSFLSVITLTHLLNEN